LYGKTESDLEKPQARASQAPLAANLGRRLFVVEELVPQGRENRWARTIALELITCRRNVA
jgi:hypothetical protein